METDRTTTTIASEAMAPVTATVEPKGRARQHRLGLEAGGARIEIIKAVCKSESCMVSRRQQRSPMHALDDKLKGWLLIPPTGRQGRPVSSPVPAHEENRPLRHNSFFSPRAT